MPANPGAHHPNTARLSQFWNPPCSDTVRTGKTDTDRFCRSSHGTGTARMTPRAPPLRQGGGSRHHEVSLGFLPDTVVTKGTRNPLAAASCLQHKAAPPVWPTGRSAHMARLKQDRALLCTAPATRGSLNVSQEHRPSALPPHSPMGWDPAWHTHGFQGFLQRAAPARFGSSLVPRWLLPALPRVLLPLQRLGCHSRGHLLLVLLPQRPLEAQLEDGAGGGDGSWERERERVTGGAAGSGDTRRRVWVRKSKPRPPAHCRTLPTR